MAAKHYVIIGTGPAGNQAALTLRQKDPHSRITLIGREEHRCYKPHLLPQLIAGQVELEELYLQPFSHYAEQDIKLRLSQAVVGLDPERRRLALAHKEVIGYDGLIIAVGGRPRIPEPLDVFADVMLTLKTIGDAQRWQGLLPSVESVLIIGGDLTSLALCKALLALGKKVSFLLTQEAFWPLRYLEEVWGQAAERLSAAGVEVLDGRLRSIVRRDPDTLEVMLDSGCHRAGLVGAFFGLVPDVRFLAGSGLMIERGILVDEHLCAGFPGVYATGDCAQVYSPQLRDYWVSIGYANAVNLGRIAAANLAGSLEEVTVPPESIFEDQGVKANTSWWAEF